MRGGKNIPLRKRPRRLPEADGAGAAIRPHIPLSKSIYFFDSLFHLIFLKAAICPCAHTGRMC